MKNRLNVDWIRKTKKSDIDPALRRYKLYLLDLGFRDSTIESYVFRAGKYLEFAGTSQPTAEDHTKFREYLQTKNLARSTLNQYGFSAKKYHEMIGIPVTFNFKKPNDTIPYYFNEDDINKIFNICRNLKHYSMLITMFFCYLRASELCNLNDEDVDFEEKTLRIREGKGGRDALVPLKPELIQVLRDYLDIRPSITVNNEHPLFITDYKRRWQKEEVHKMFCKYKKLAGINKPGGLHVFGRHSPASILVKNGCDILTIKELMRHKDITTTARYLHISDQVKRQKHEKYLKL